MKCLVSLVTISKTTFDPLNLTEIALGPFIPDMSEWERPDRSGSAHSITLFSAHSGVQLDPVLLPSGSLSGICRVNEFRCRSSPISQIQKYFELNISTLDMA